MAIDKTLVSGSMTLLLLKLLSENEYPAALQSRKKCPLGFPCGTLFISRFNAGTDLKTPV